MEDLPIPYTQKDIETGEWLLNDIWQGGNFGQHNQNRKQRPKDTGVEMVHFHPRHSTMP